MFQLVPRIMVFFWAIKAHLVAFLLLFILNSIVSGYQCRVFLLLIFLLMLFLSFLIIKLGGLIVVGQSRGFAISRLHFLGLRLFGARFFSNGSLGLHLQRNIVGRMVALGTMDIQIPEHSVRSKAHFGFRIDCLLHYLFKASWRLILLLHFNLNRAFKVFLEVADHSELIGGPDSAELYKNRLEILKVGGIILSLF